MIVIVIGNKIDMKEKRIISEDEIKELCYKFSVDYFETSARENINVNAAFNNVTEKIMSNKKLLMKKRENTIKLGKISSNNNLTE